MKNKFWSKKLLKNKLGALSLISLGAVTTFIDNDGTAFLFLLMLGMPMFFCKEDVFMNEEEINE
ncbi:MAG: hypothetical protein R3Y12_04160 [Clostridia bacterium]